MLDLSTEFGRRVDGQLQSEHVIWLTTVGPDDTPQPRPVWFLWDGTSVLTYSRPNTHKLRHIARVPRVSLNFSSDSKGHEVAVLTGEARVDQKVPPADEHPEYMAKYDRSIADLGMTPPEFAREYSTAIRVTPTRVRGL